MIRLRLLLLLPALFCISKPASAQIPRQNPQIPRQNSQIPGGDTRESRQYSVRGWVSDSVTHMRIEGVRVDLNATTGGAIGTTFTRGNGEFEFDNIGQGSYTLVATYSGYATTNEQVQVFYGSVLGLEVELRRSGDSNSKLAPGPNKVSVRQLSIPHKAQDAMKNGLNLLYAKSDYNGSIKQFERAIQEYPDYYEAYAAIGVAYIGLKDPANAEQSLRKSIDVSHEHYVEAYCVLADLFSSDKRFSEAEPLARKGVELDADSWQANSELARALVGLDRATEAEESATKAVKLAPENAQLRLLIANVHMNEQDYPALLDDLNSYLKLAPNGPFAEQARRQRDDIQQHLAAENATSPEQKTQP